MTKYCLKNPEHKKFGVDKFGVEKCLVPGCEGRLGDREVEKAAEDAFERGAEDYTLNRDREKVERTIIEAETADTGIEAAVAKARKAEAKLSADVERLEAEKTTAGTAGDAPPDTEVAVSRGQPETLVEHVEHGVESLVAGEVAEARATIANLVERARGKEAEARQSADAAAQHAKTATDAAAQAAANAKPHAGQQGFDEAARHASGADYHASVSQAAAAEAADHAAAATDARQTVDGLAARAETQTTAGALQALVAEIEKAVAVVAEFAAKAAAALARAKAASGEATTLGGFFMEALSLWRSLRGQ
jgi:hypothetical protein